ncbi:MAG: prohibitin family protein [Spirochaetes bacterium]|nr:prohibitin family protein [Spirochaetota bacterium]
MKKIYFFAAFVAILFSGCVSTVKPGEVGLRWHPWTSGLGKEALQPQTYVYAPWNDIYLYRVQWTSFSEQVEILTKDDLKVQVISTVILRPNPEEIYQLQQEIGIDFYSKVVKPLFRTSVRNALSTYSMIDISKETPNISDHIKKVLIEKLAGKHIDINDVIIDDIEYSKPILRAIEGKLEKEQEQQQMVFAIKIAERDAEITVIKAKADAAAVRLRAEGQAQAQAIINKQLTTKYIQLKAVENPNTKMMIFQSGKDGLPVIINTNEK